MRLTLSRGFLLLAILLSAEGVFGQQTDSKYQQARYLSQKGEEAIEEGEYRVAISYIEDASDIYKSLGDTVQWLQHRLMNAECLLDVARYQHARKELKKLETFSNTFKSDSLRAKIKNDFGYLYDKIGKLDSALIYYKEGLEISKASADSITIGITTSNMGSIYYEMGNFEKALDYSHQSRHIFEQLNRHFNLSISYNNLGVYYKKLDMYEEARTYYTKSLELKKKLDNISLLATAYNNLASLNQSIGEYSTALSQYYKSLEYRRETGNPHKTSRTLGNIGALYSSFNEDDKALSYYQQSLMLREQYGSEYDVAHMKRNIASLKITRQQYRQAEELLMEVLQIDKKLGNSDRICKTYFTLSDIKLSTGSFGQAREYIEQAFQTIGDNSAPSVQAEAYRMYANLHIHLNNSDSSLYYYKKALKVLEGQPFHEQLSTIKGLAYTYSSIDKDSAIYYGEQVIDYLKQSRDQFGPLSILKAKYFGRHTHFYFDLAAWYLESKNDAERAFELIETAKARGFNEDLARASANLDRKLPEDLRVKKRQMEKQLRELYEDLQEVDKPVLASRLKESIRDRELQYQSFINKIKETESYRSFDIPEPMSLSGARQLCDAETAMLQYAVSDNHIILFAVSEDGYQSHVIKKSSDDTTGLTARLANRVEQYRTSILSNMPKSMLTEDSGSLVDQLISPVYQHIKGKHNIIVIPDGALAYLPFETLIMEDEYLIQKFNIKYLPSVSTVGLLHKKADSYSKDILALAGSKFEGVEQGLGQKRQNRYYTLPSTLLEVDSISSKFAKADVLKEKEVSERRLKQMHLQQYRYIHMATHGIFNESHPELSGLVLSTNGDKQNEMGLGEDGFLRNSEIYELNLNAEMVVLSACNTGMGNLIRGEGIFGIQRAFLQAGASSVVVSLWNVFDRSTATFMTTFYENLNSMEGQEKSYLDQFWDWMDWQYPVTFGTRAKAMRQAKLAMLEHPVYKHPVYWAPFIVVGR